MGESRADWQRMNHLFNSTSRPVESRSNRAFHSRFIASVYAFFYRSNSARPRTFACANEREPSTLMMGLFNVLRARSKNSAKSGGGDLRKISRRLNRCIGTASRHSCAGLSRARPKSGARLIMPRRLSKCQR